MCFEFIPNTASSNFCSCTEIYLVIVLLLFPVTMFLFIFYCFWSSGKHRFWSNSTRESIKRDRKAQKHTLAPVYAWLLVCPFIPSSADCQLTNLTFSSRVNATAVPIMSNYSDCPPQALNDVSCSKYKKYNWKIMLNIVNPNRKNWTKEDIDSYCFKCNLQNSWDTTQ